MIAAQGVSLQYGGRVLFNDVNINFTKGNCYGLIGANGAGKSTFLKILSGEIEPNKGSVFITPGERMAVLKQDHFLFDELEVVQTVLYGHKRLYEIMKEKEELYSKADFTDEDGIKVSELEGEFAELDGWSAESNAEILLNGLGITNELHYVKMKELTGTQKVKVLLAQALFGNPDILLLDEPTNHLDIHAIRWLEDFLMNFENTVIVVSHDRHFLNKVCTNIADIDYGKITMFVGNYDFWYSFTQLTQRQIKDQNKRTEQKMKELQEFIQRFSANASKAKQATSRKKLLDNLQMDTVKPSSRRYPFCSFKQDREVGNDVLLVENISKTIDGKKILDNISFMIRPNEKVAFVGKDEIARTALFQILMGEMEPDEGKFKWGITTKTGYFPKDNSEYFEGCKESLIEWLRPFAKEGEQYDADIRGWLGRMLFSGEEALKSANVLSGGEKVRCMLCKMMMSGANVLIMDEPTNHLDLEAITALNEGLSEYKGTLLFDSHDHQFVQTIADRIIEILPGGIIDRQMTYDEYLEDEEINNLRLKLTEEA
ncbi:ABC-F family ATP-binding cassette domain-containing protein [Anaerotignum propionicum]|jgi:ATPase subunit of ABC transporter with duplicated ATPase domains|uniref:ABC transporter ATP-binding protein YbiT n=1 Tax=Anaerotignum propionicum DSM 1682 TaxID=991789 RepID=A0A0X8VE71_ANAPI|nr:ATP-binding cassette domain-containing protein [Anaerotignum propionicum]AMJ42354.1 putative ABC transporter ATP-binding protein YbiT [Anaerotignum propionicum DSM 1682]MEA5056760.1 ATP-binding cassette domain-containing protein [Anaerotignum propionicum]SHF00268.1 ATPase components of ABC transporters with duplicated ATPase domains [[Clostridium] propionicum DSM 1682] [Anaerotignum propionicum DSM 1682]